jgi:signal transduction histidine kinase
MVMASMEKFVACRSNAYQVTLESPDVPVLVNVDGQQMELIVENLLSNSAEAMFLGGVAPGDGRISVTVSHAQDMAQVCIRDQGPGVPPELERRVYEPFFSTKTEGIGMGLAICRTLVEAQGGRLWHESAGPGAKFYFTVPIAR